MNEDLSRSFEQLDRALGRLKEALAQPREAELAVDGTIQRFEFTIELLWKVLKRFLETDGIRSASPRESLQKAFQAGWIDSEEPWLEMLRSRNLTSHTYNEALASSVYESIRKNLPELETLVRRLGQRLPP